MSLLQKASIITTPTAYAEDYLYSIKPAYALGSELITQFDGVSDGTDVATLAGWSAYNTATSRNIVDEKLVIVASGSNQGAYFQAGTVAGTKYLLTATITGDLGAGGVYVNNVSNVSTESGKIEFIFTALVSATFIYFRASNNTAGTTTYADISLKPITDADFDFDRNSTGTRVNEDYLIEDVPYNLLTYSEDFSDSSWSKYQMSVTSGFASPDGKNNAFKLVENSNNDSHILFKNNITTGSGKTTLSIKAKAGERKWILFGDFEQNNRVYFDLENGVAGTVLGSPDSYSITSVKNGWYNITLTSTSVTQIDFQVYLATGNNQATYTGDGSSGVYIWGAQLVKGDQPKDYLKTTDRLDIPRIDYTNGEPSILLEPSRQNLILNSTAISLSPIKNATFVDNFAISPEGIQNATKITATSTDPYFYQSVSFTAGDYTASIYVKGIGQSIGKEFRFAISNQTHISNKYIIPSEWTRFEFTGSVTTSTATTGLEITDPAVVGDEILVWGWQVEAGSYATSLIHTSGSAVTRSADAPNNAGNSDLFNDSEGVLYAEILPNKAPVGIYELISIGDNSGSNVVTLGTNNDGIRLFAGLRLSGTYQALIEPNANFTEYQKIAISYKVNEFKLYINGTQVGIDTSGSVFPANTLNSLRFNFDGASAHSYKGKAKMVAVFKEALTDLELEKLTGYNNHELYMNYYNRLSYLGLAEEYNVESDINNYIL